MGLLLDFCGVVCMVVKMNFDRWASSIPCEEEGDGDDTLQALTSLVAKIFSKILIFILFWGLG